MTSSTEVSAGCIARRLHHLKKWRSWQSYTLRVEALRDWAATSAARYKRPAALKDFVTAPSTSGADPLEPDETLRMSSMNSIVSRTHLSDVT